MVLQNFLIGLRLALNNDKDEQFGTKAAKIVSIMLNKNNGKYSRIGIFRRPDEEGSLDKSELLQEGKQNLNRVIYDNLKFVKTRPDTFGYTISEKSKLSLLSMIDKLNDFIALVLRKAAADIKGHYKRLGEAKPSKVAKELKLGYSTFLTLSTNTTGKTTGPEFINNLVNSIQSARIPMTVKQLDDIQNKFKFVFFLQQVSALQFKTRPHEWVDSFRFIGSTIKTSVQKMQRQLPMILLN